MMLLDGSALPCQTAQQKAGSGPKAAILLQVVTLVIKNVLVSSLISSALALRTHP